MRPRREKRTDVLPAHPIGDGIMRLLSIGTPTGAS